MRNFVGISSKNNKFGSIHASNKKLSSELNSLIIFGILRNKIKLIGKNNNNIDSVCAPKKAPWSS